MFTKDFEGSKEQNKLIIPDWAAKRLPVLPRYFKEGAHQNPETELENRIWRLLWNLRPNVINKEKFEFDFSKDQTISRDGRRPDAFAILQNRYVFINESKYTSSKPRTKTVLEDDPHYSHKLRNAIKTRLNKLFEIENPVFIYLMTTEGWAWTEDDKALFRKEHKTIVLTSKELEYFENCLKLSDSPNFTFNQFLGFYLNNTKGLTEDLDVNAFKIPQGAGRYSYTFSASPRELMRMSIISHRQAKNLDLPVYEELESVQEDNVGGEEEALVEETLVKDEEENNPDGSSHKDKNNANDDQAFYQRILTKGRLKDLKSFIEENNRAFYNNILVSWRGKDSRFKEEKVTGTERGVKLNIKGYPGSFHVIDGQHRLFGYSEITDDSILDNHTLIITCFKGSKYTVKDEAIIFKEVNSQQKKVDKSLLYEIDAILGKESTGKEQKDILAKVVIGRLRDDPNSPFQNPKAIKEPELPRQKAPLTPVNLIDYGLSKTNIIGTSSEISSGTGYLNDFDSTLTNVTLLLAKFFKRIRSRNEKKWNKEHFLKNFFINALMLTLDRIIDYTSIGKKLSSDKLIESCSEPIDVLCYKLSNMNEEDNFEFFNDASIKKFRGGSGPNLALKMILYKYLNDDYNGIITKEEIKDVENLYIPEESDQVKELKNRIAELERSPNPELLKKVLNDVSEQTKTIEEQVVLYEQLLYDRIDPILSIIFGDDYYRNLISRHIKEVHKRIQTKIDERAENPLVKGMKDENKAFYTKEIYWSEPSDLVKMLKLFTQNNKDLNSEEKKRSWENIQNQSETFEIRDIFKELFFIAPRKHKGKKPAQLNSDDGLQWLELMNVLRRPRGHPRPENITISEEMFEFKHYDYYIKLKFAKLDKFIKDHTK